MHWCAPPPKGGSYRHKSTTCPLDAIALPWVGDILEAYRQTLRFAHHLPRAGGLEDQDALTLSGLLLLKEEEPHFEAHALEELRHDANG